MQQFLNFVSAYIHPTQDELEFILRSTKVKLYKKNAYLIKQGEVSKRMMFILKGVAKASYTDNNGIEHISEFIFENQPVIYMEAFTKNTPSGVNVVSLEDTEVLVASRDHFFEFLQKFPRFEGVLRDMLVEYMSLDLEHTRILRINSSKERYETLLKYRPDIIQRVPLKHIASYLNMALETLSRVRAGKL